MDSRCCLIDELAKTRSGYLEFLDWVLEEMQNVFMREWEPRVSYCVFCGCNWFIMMLEWSLRQGKAWSLTEIWNGQKWGFYMWENTSVLFAILARLVWLLLVPHDREWGKDHAIWYCAMPWFFGVFWNRFWKVQECDFWAWEHQGLLLWLDGGYLFIFRQEMTLRSAVEKLPIGQVLEKWPKWGLRENERTKAFCWFGCYLFIFWQKNEVKFAARLLLFLIEFCHLAKWERMSELVVLCWLGYAFHCGSLDRL